MCVRQCHPDMQPASPEYSQAGAVTAPSNALNLAASCADATVLWAVLGKVSAGVSHRPWRDVL